MRIARLSILFLAALVSAAQGQEVRDDLPAAPAGKTWKMVWHDEFDGTKVDESKWEIMPDAPRKGGWWMRKAVALDGKGHLAISTLKEGDKYIDGCVRTKGKFEHSFGYYVARVQLQKQTGHWSAFWLMGEGVGKVGSGGREGTEIDIYEKPWLNNKVQHTLHWDGYGKDHKSLGHVAKVPGVMDGWHTFGLWWKADEYVFYVDGKETWRTKASGVSQVPEYIKLSDEIGAWAGDIKKAKLPDKFLVDYVRVYDVVEKPFTARKEQATSGCRPPEASGLRTTESKGRAAPTPWRTARGACLLLWARLAQGTLP